MRAFLMIAVFAIAVPDRPNPSPPTFMPPHEQILGDWRIESGPDDGVLRVLRFTKSEMLILVNGNGWDNDAFSGPHIIEWDKTPVAYDNLRNKNYGILRLDGDQLLLCQSLGGNRPTDFVQEQGHVLRLSRMKK
jgi:hypothetical protein